MENLFAAILVAQRLGMKNFEIQEAVSRLQPLPGRGQIRRAGRFTIIDETYNSNPEALKKTLQWVDREYRQKKAAVLGDMLELGRHELRFHGEVGRFFAGLHFDLLLTVGRRAETDRQPRPERPVIPPGASRASPPPPKPGIPAPATAAGNGGRRPVQGLAGHGPGKGHRGVRP